MKGCCLLLLCVFIANTTPQIHAETSEIKPHLQLDEQGESLVVQQRRSQLVRGSAGSITISIGDITGSMVLVSLEGKDSTPVLRETPMAEGEMVSFRVKKQGYVLFLRQVRNVLGGDDTAEFRIVRQCNVSEAMKRADANKKSKPQGLAVGAELKTNVSGAIKLDKITRGDAAYLRSDGELFSLKATHWAWLSHDEILKVTHISKERQTVTVQLYHPAPFPRPF